MTQFDEDQGAETPRLGRYEILGEIASGGMATVFLARAVGAGGFSRLMAIKRLHPHLETDDDFVRMFLDEARLAARIRHPNVVATLDVEDHDGLYIVMEYIEGVTLQQLARSAQRVGERVPIPVAARIALDILAGLNAAHELRDEHDQFLNLVHRDVSPQNVLLGTDGAARLTDFGIAKAASRLSMTRDGQLKGKISYMAPEQTRRGEVDRRADVFAMGIVVWEVLAGRRLFSGETDVEVLNQLLFEPIPRLKDHAPTLPSMLEQTVMRALERDPAARYASASQFGDALDRATRMLGGPANHRVVAAFIQKVAGERIARERGRIASGGPVSDPASTGSYKALDANGLPSSRVRPSSAPPPSERGFDPMPPRARSLRAPTMTGPVYAPDEGARTTLPPRAPRRPSPLRPPTMPSLGAPRRSEEGIDPFKSTLLGVGEAGSATRSPGPPAIIEFDPGESPTIATMATPFPSAVRSRTPAPLGPNANTAIDHEAVTRLDPMRQPPPVDTSEPGSEAATLSVPVSMLFGAPQGTPNFAPHPPQPQRFENPSQRPENPSQRPENPSQRFENAPQQFAPSPQVVDAPPQPPQQPPVGAAPPTQPAPEASPKPASRALLFVLAIILAMGLGAALTLYLTGYFSQRPAPLPPAVRVVLPPPAVDAGVALAVTPDAATDAADDVRDDAQPLAAVEDATSATTDAPQVERDDASLIPDDAAEPSDAQTDASADDDATTTTATDAAPEETVEQPSRRDDSNADAGTRRRRHRRRDGSDDGGAPRARGAVPADPPTGPLGDPFGGG